MAARMGGAELRTSTPSRTVSHGTQKVATLQGAAPTVGARSYRATVQPMAATEKISVAMGREELRLAKAAAREAGVSLSAFVTAAVRDRLTEKRRWEAAREVLAIFDREDFPTPQRERELLELWSTPPVPNAPSAHARRKSSPRGTRAASRMKRR